VVPITVALESNIQLYAEKYKSPCTRSKVPSICIRKIQNRRGQCSRLPPSCSGTTPPNGFKSRVQVYISALAKLRPLCLQPSVKSKRERLRFPRRTARGCSAVTAAETSPGSRSQAGLRTSPPWDDLRYMCWFGSLVKCIFVTATAEVLDIGLATLSFERQSTCVGCSSLVDPM
jgi:hypothetical protein